jgi:hypothetical protein
VLGKIEIRSVADEMYALIFLGLQFWAFSHHIVWIGAEEAQFFSSPFGTLSVIAHRESCTSASKSVLSCKNSQVALNTSIGIIDIVSGTLVVASQNSPSDSSALP